jgi:hypothetical protein
MLSMRKFPSITTIFKEIANSLDTIKNDIIDKDETKYKILYEYIVKQNDAEISRTRALENKTQNLFTIGVFLLTFYTSFLLFLLKVKFDLNLLISYITFSIGVILFVISVWFWTKATKVKEFGIPTIDTIEDNVRYKCKTPEGTYLYFYKKTLAATKQRRSVNKQFGKDIRRASKMLLSSLVFLFVCIVSRPINWYSELITPKQQPQLYKVELMLNYIEPEEIPEDELDVMLEDINGAPQQTPTND